MNKAPVAVKEKATFESSRVTIDHQLNEEAEEEPPGKLVISPKAAEKPSGKNATGRYGIFPKVPDIYWNDWKWHFRNRITTIENLSQVIPLSIEERAQLEQVVERYLLSITPHYLSLMDIDNPDDPANPQAFNRYSYCINNPLKHVDPSGYIVTFSIYADMNNPYYYMSLLQQARALTDAWNALGGVAPELTSAMENDTITYIIRFGETDLDAWGQTSGTTTT